MSFADEHNSELQKLLRCKRYEQPPPGYFYSFSDNVIARIEAETTSHSLSWWRALLERFDARPVLVCAYGLAVSSLLLVGIRLSQAFEAEVTAAPSLSGPWLAAGPASPLLPEGMNRADFTGSLPSTSLAASKLFFKEEPTHLAFPAGGFRVQSASFTIGR